MRRNTVILIALILMIAIATTWFFVSNQPTSNTINSNITVSFLNVGQGDATYFRLADGTDALVDGGPDNRVLQELGKVMPTRDKEINLVLLTHEHADHINGLFAVIKHYKVDEVWITRPLHKNHRYLALLKLIHTKKIHLRFVASGYTSNLEKLHISVLFPLPTHHQKSLENEHEETLVSRWEFGNFSILMTGDLNLAEINKIDNSGQYLRSTILKVPHHGSSTSLNRDFLRRITPKVAVISVGKHNRFGHPTKPTIFLLKNFGITTYRTDQIGRVSFTSNGATWGK